MSKAATIEVNARDTEFQAQAVHYLAETNRILKRLARERSRHARRPQPTTNIVTEVKAILQGALPACIKRK